MDPLLIDIQKFSVFDGDGIRTSVFFKGCGLQCAWCHNPESIGFQKDILYNSEKCINCGRCEKVCLAKAITKRDIGLEVDREACTGCGDCMDVCVACALEVSGKAYSVDEIVKEVEKDRIFYERSHGGVTFTGGECMLQDMDFFEALLKKLKTKGYHIVVDTSGYAPEANFQRLLPYVDVFLFDFKIMDAESHKKYMGKDNTLILSNLEFLSKQGANINLRLPLITGVNAHEEHINSTIEYLKEKKINTYQVNLLPYHDIGKHKYNRLDLDYPAHAFTVPAPELLEEFKEIFIREGFKKVVVGG